MRGKFLYSFIVLVFLAGSFLVSSTSYAQTTGSIGGRVLDANDNSPLAGATIKVDGTPLGAVTDDNGEYVILNVDVGTYTVIASYIGYTDTKVNGVKVSVDQRTKIDFDMKPEGEVVTDVIEITAERKGIDVDQSGRLITQDQIDDSGVRGIQNIVSKTAGVVQDERGNNINIRGGRTDENVIIVDGVVTTNPIDGTSTAFVSNGLLQEIAVYTGGFGAEYGNVLSGVINVTTKGGTDKYTGSIEAATDEFSGDWLNTVAQGYNLYSLTFGGPLIPTKDLSKVINFYGGVEKQFLLVRNPSWISRDLFSDGIIPNFTENLYSYNARLNINFSDIKGSSIPINLKGGLLMTDDHNRSFIQSYYKSNSFRNPLEITKDRQFYGRMIHNVSSKFFYELQFTNYSTTDEFGDPYFLGNWFAYGDTNSIPELMAIQRETGILRQGSRLGNDPSTENVFFLPGRVNNFYSKSDVSYIGGKADATFSVLTKKYGDHEVKFGGEYKYNTLRSLELSPVALANNPIVGTDPSGNPIYQLNPTDLFFGREVLLKSYGYEVRDQYGNPIIVSGEDFEPRNPIIAAAYLRDKIDFGDLTINAGLRMDYLDVNTEVLKDPNNLLGPDGQLLSDDDFEQSSADIEFSPRLGFSFPVTDKTVFIANYGRFVQLPQLQLMYIPREYFQKFFSNSVQNVVENSGLEPEKLTSYEVGFKQQVGDIINLGITAFYKETRDQIGTARILKGPGVPSGYAIYENTDFSLARGLEMYFSMRRYQRASIDISYTLSYSSGVGSDPFSKFSLANNPDGVFPKFLFPTDFDQRHTGSINLDYRFGNDDVPKGFGGEILKNLGFNFLFSFNSGRPYTVRSLPKNAFDNGDVALSSKNGVYTDWNTRLDFKMDKTIDIWKTSLNIYVYVLNLFDTELVNSVYGATGLPDDNGYLTTPTGSQTSANYQSNWRDRVRAITNWGPPRQVRFGAKLSF